MGFLDDLLNKEDKRSKYTLTPREANNPPTPEVLKKVSFISLGMNNSTLYDPTNDIKYDKTDDENIYQGKHNTFIVFGRDRPGKADGQGYGAKGFEKSGAIDIVVGRWSNTNAIDFIGVPQSSNTATDAARIYISQKSDIDLYYGIKGGKTGLSDGNSAIAIKADDVRIISRSSLKIVTNTDTELSNGKSSDSRVGIQIIANNDDSDMQAIPKGTNLEHALNAILDNILQLRGIFAAFVTTQSKYNDELATHVHYSPFFAQECSPSQDALPQGISTSLEVFTKTTSDLKKFISAIKKTKFTYLNQAGKEYINSRYNFVN
jgi:hypothetical protein